MSTQIGAQLYTLRDQCRNAGDFAKTCKRLADIGFGAVQVSAVNVDDPKQIKTILDDHGLICAATHEDLDKMRDTEKILDAHRTLDCQLTAIGGFGAKSKTQWQSFADDFGAVGRTLGAGGLRVGYHNHSHELAPFAEDPAQRDPSDIPLQLLVDRLDKSVWFEIDTYWIAHGGGDPVAWIEKVKGRIPAVHVKDMTITPERKQMMCEVGAGNLNWPRILEACRAAGVQWYLIERDDGDLDPFESLRISMENLRGWGVV